jgi:Cu2+-exporting ATPase
MERNEMFHLTTVDSDPSSSEDALQHESFRCRHCGLPVPESLVDSRQRDQFCCSGCATAFAVITGCGLENYYKLRDALNARPSPARSRGSKYTTFDDAPFLAKHVVTTSAGLNRIEFVLSGLHCGACVWLIERLPRLAPGIVRAHANLARGTAVIEWQPERIKLSEIATWCDRLGYPPSPAGNRIHAHRFDAEHRRQLARLGLAGALAGNAMLAALANYCGVFDGISLEYARLFGWVSAGLGLVAVFGPGSVFFTNAWTALRARVPSMDIPIALGVGAGTLAGVIDTVTGTHDAYFDSLAVLVFLLLLGRYIKFLQMRRAADAMTLLQSITPRTALKKRGDGSFQEVSIESLQPNDIVQIPPGELIPADGTILEGRSTIDRSLITGESVGVSVGPGTDVPGGAINQSSPLTMRVLAVGMETRVGKLMTLVEDAVAQKPAVLALADRVSGWLVIAIVLLATLTMIWWLPSGGSTALRHTVALLIVACPCALGLATPLAFAVAQGKAARSGTLIRSADSIERLSGRGIIWLDKTGTITEGKLTLIQWMGDASVRSMVAAVERLSNHPIGKALTFETDLKADEFMNHPGLGVSAWVNGSNVLVGNLALMERHQVPNDRGLEREAHHWLAQGCSVVFVARDGRLVAAAALGDRIRPGSAETIKRLQSAGWIVGLLSGDDPGIVNRVAAMVGIPTERAIGGMVPEQKLSIIRDSISKEPTLMVGDGVNDSAALAAASVGIAVQGGAETALHAADVYLSRPGLEPLHDLISGSRRAMGVVYRNFAVSLTYNAVAVGLAMAGIMTPLIAAVLMPISSLTVTTLSLTGRSYEVCR